MQSLKFYISKIKAVFQQGLSPKSMALSITISLIVTAFPVFGLSTIVLTALALRFKLNLALTLTLSYLIEPLKLLLIIPFINLGAFIIDSNPTFTSINAIQNVIETEVFMDIITLLYLDISFGILGWFVTVIPLSFIFYRSLKWLLLKQQNNKNAI